MKAEEFFGGAQYLDSGDFSGNNHGMKARGGRVVYSSGHAFAAQANVTLPNASLYESYEIGGPKFIWINKSGHNELFRRFTTSGTLFTLGNNQVATIHLREAEDSDGKWTWQIQDIV